MRSPLFEMLFQGCFIADDADPAARDCG